MNLLAKQAPSLSSHTPKMVFGTGVEPVSTSESCWRRTPRPTEQERATGIEPARVGVETQPPTIGISHAKAPGRTCTDLFRVQTGRVAIYASRANKSRTPDSNRPSPTYQAGASPPRPVRHEVEHLTGVEPAHAGLADRPPTNGISGA